MKHCPGCGTFYEGNDKEVCDHDGIALEVVQEAEKAADPFLGTVVDGRYLVQSILGKGGMGAVYKARQTSVERDIALKVILGETDEDARRRFMLEAKMTSSLQSVHTVTIFDFGVFNDVLYLAMEYLEGQSLEDKLDAVDQLDWRAALEIVSAISESLEEAHEKSIIHRDLKPANIYLAKMGSNTNFVKVLDFGVAKFVSDDNTNLTGTGMIVGTPNYMSPEQARAKPLDARSDIYALGVMLYEMLAGVPPFSGEATVDVLLKHVTEEPPPIFDEDLVSPLPEGLRGLLMAMLAKDPKARPQTAKAVAEACKTLLRGESLGEDYLDPMAEPTERVQRPSNLSGARGITGEESTLAGPALANEAGNDDTALAPSPFNAEAETSDAVESLEAPRSNKGMLMGIAALLVGGVAIAALTLGGGQGEDASTKRAEVQAAASKADEAKPSSAANVDKATAAQATGSEAPQDEVPALDEKAPAEPSKVTLVSSPPGAKVVLPNGLTGKTPLELESGESPLVVTVKLEGYLDLIHTIAPKSAGEQRVTLSVDEAARRAKVEAQAKAKAEAEAQAKAKAEAEAQAKAKAKKRAQKKRAAKNPAAKKPAAKPKKPKKKSSRPGLF